MRAISLFSGAGGFELGFERAGIETVLQAESDPWCRTVLKRHWPEVQRIGDVRDLRDGAFPSAAGQQQLGPVDLVYGGFPCQDLSVAGRRAGLGGERSALWFEFERVLSELRPRWAVIENVPGLLSSNRGRDLAVILRALDELGFAVAWAVLDAQHFGVPQRRRRVFIAAGPRRRGVEQVLALCESCGGHPETGGEEGQTVAGPLGGGSGSRGWAGDLDRMRAYVSTSHARTAQHGHRLDPTAETFVVTHTLRSEGADASEDGTGRGTPLVAQPLRDNTAAGVRRLTPRECERLMAWPDDWTRWTADGREIADSHRYRMIGNGVVATVAEWIGRRLVAVDMMLEAMP